MPLTVMLLIFYVDTKQLGQLLLFITGLEMIPPLGFDPQPTIKFKHCEDLDANDPKKDYPSVNTCSNSITLPVLSSYDYFKKKMVEAITMPTTFNTE